MKIGGQFVGTHAVVHTQSDGAVKGYISEQAAKDAAAEKNERAMKMGLAARYHVEPLPANAKAAA
jgi:hypothetical protein